MSETYGILIKVGLLSMYFGKFKWFTPFYIFSFCKLIVFSLNYTFTKKKMVHYIVGLIKGKVKQSGFPSHILQRMLPL